MTLKVSLKKSPKRSLHLAKMWPHGCTATSLHNVFQRQKWRESYCGDCYLTHSFLFLTSTWRKKTLLYFYPRSSCSHSQKQDIFNIRIILGVIRAYTSIYLSLHINHSNKTRKRCSQKLTINNFNYPP